MSAGAVTSVTVIDFSRWAKRFLISVELLGPATIESLACIAKCAV